MVHLQGVPLSKRFALVPLGPPLLTYSSTCKACAWECCSDCTLRRRVHLPEPAACEPQARELNG